MKRFIILAFLLLCIAAQAQVFTDYADTLRLNEFTKLEEAIKDPLSVQRLILNRKGLKEIPPEVFTMTNLVELDLRGNRIANIPPEIEKLTKLRFLDISKNRLNTLPAQFGKLENLVYLEMAQNPLVVLPTEFGNLKSLQYLSAWDTELITLPYFFTKLKALKQVDLRAIIITQTERDENKTNLPEGVEVFYSADCNCTR